MMRQSYVVQMSSNNDNRITDDYRMVRQSKHTNRLEKSKVIELAKAGI